MRRHSDKIETLVCGVTFHDFQGLLTEMDIEWDDHTEIRFWESFTESNFRDTCDLERSLKEEIEEWCNPKPPPTEQEKEKLRIEMEQMYERAAWNTVRERLMDSDKVREHLGDSVADALLTAHDWTRWVAQNSS